MIDVSVVIACYNEEPILADSVQKIMAIMDSTCWKYEIIFVDDHSHDKTKEIINQINKNYPHKNIKKIFHKKNLGRGRTVTDGIYESNGKYVGYLDIDLEVGAHYIPRMIVALEQEADIATAFRVYKSTSRLFIRMILSIGYRFLMHLLLRVPIKDSETGFKFFNREKILPILNKTKDPGWFWDTEIMTRSYLAGLKIIELPCLFIKRFDKKSSVHVLKDTMEYFINLFKFNQEIKSLRRK